MLSMFGSVPLTTQTVSVIFALLVSLVAIPLIAWRVMPYSNRNRVYYYGILAQVLVDCLQTLAVIGMNLIPSPAIAYKVKYLGILAFQLSVMMTAFLGIHWMDLLIRSKTIKKMMYGIVGGVSVPMVLSTAYLICAKNSTDDIQNFEWMLMSGSRTAAQLLFAVVIFIASFKVFKITSLNTTPNTKRTYRKVWKGLVCKVIISVGVALFGINTFIGILAHGNLLRYMAENEWWSPTYFSVTSVYCGVNTLITLWMLLALILKKKNNKTTSVTPIDKSLKNIQSARRI